MNSCKKAAVVSLILGVAMLLLSLSFAFGAGKLEKHDPATFTLLVCSSVSVALIACFGLFINAGGCANIVHVVTAKDVFRVRGIIEIEQDNKVNEYRLLIEFGDRSVAHVRATPDDFVMKYPKLDYWYQISSYGDSFSELNVAKN